MKRAPAAVLLIAVTTLFAAPRAEAAVQFKATLRGFEEVPPVSTIGNGKLEAELNDEGTELAWELTLPNAPTNITQAHIHFGQAGVNGGIMIFFCTNLGNGPAGTQACPVDGGTISGVATAASVVGAVGQGIPAADLFPPVRAMKSGISYANIHTVQFGGGEFRGQIKVVSSDADDGGDTPVTSD